MNTIVDKMKRDNREKKNRTYLLFRSATKRDKASPLELDMTVNRVYQTSKDDGNQAAGSGGQGSGSGVCKVRGTTDSPVTEDAEIARIL
jgi:hypothetical protein